MANMISLELVQSTPSSNGGFICKLQQKNEQTVKTGFGTKVQNHQVTYYLKLQKVTAKVGDVKEIDLDAFNVVERPFTIEDPDSDNYGETVNLKWLQLK